MTYFPPCSSDSISSMLGIPIVAQRVKNLTVSVRMWVQSLASLSGSRIWHCCELQSRSQMRLRTTTRLPIPHFEKHISASVLNLLCYHPSHSRWKSPLDSSERIREKKDKYQLIIIMKNSRLKTEARLTVPHFEQNWCQTLF